MKQIIYTLVTIALFFACTQKGNQEKFSKHKHQVDALTDIPVNANNADSLNTQWQALLALALTDADSVSVSRVYYNLARFHAMKGSDSAQYLIEQSLDFIEPTEGNWEEKAMSYLGLGNVWHAKAQEHQASYYYNNAAAIVMADTGLDLSPSSKAAMLLSASQSNDKLYQYVLARQMNETAAKLKDQLAPDDPLRQRIITQSFSNLSHLKTPVDSLWPLVQELEHLHQSFPEAFDRTFLYDTKARYYLQLGNTDSILSNQLAKIYYDDAKLEKQPDSKVFINNKYINHVNIAASYLMKNEPSLAKKYLDIAAGISKGQESIILTYHFLMYLNNCAQLAEAEGQYQKASDLRAEAYEVQKEFFQSENVQAVAEMSSLYQLQSKDKSIKKLSENVRINDLELKQTYLWLTVSLLVALLLVSYLFVLRNGIKQRKLRQEKEKLSLQQQLLRTQMEPHFIFNTLAAVQSFVRFDQKDKAIKYLNQFSRLLRSSLELSRENLVPLEEEIETLDNYMSLQQMRFESSFSYEINVDDEESLDGIVVPPMLIQPYVENAILHGIDLQSGKAAVNIIVKLDEDVLEVTIEDNGKPQEVAQKALHRSLSGTIGKDRLQILGKKAGLRFEPNNEGGHTVVLRIPVVVSE